MSMRSWCYKVFLAPGAEENPPISQVASILVAVEKRLGDCEKVTWRNDKRLLRAFGAIPVDDEKQQVQTQGDEQPAAILSPGEGEPTLTPEQIQQMFSKGV